MVGGVNLSLLRQSKHPAAMIERHAEVFGVIFFMIFALYFDVSFFYMPSSKVKECNLEIISFDFVIVLLLLSFQFST